MTTQHSNPRPTDWWHRVTCEAVARWLSIETGLRLFDARIEARQALADLRASCLPAQPHEEGQA